MIVKRDEADGQVCLTSFYFVVHGHLHTSPNVPSP